MTVVESGLDHWVKEQERRKVAVEPKKAKRTLKGGGGGGTSSPMESRVSKLEAYVEVTREDIREIKGDLKALADSVGKLATKSDLESWKWQWVFIALAVIALTVAGITGGLALIARSSTPAPTSYVAPPAAAAPQNN